MMTLRQLIKLSYIIFVLFYYSRYLLTALKSIKKMACNLKKRRIESDESISCSATVQREQMLVHEIRLSNVLNMASCHDYLKSEIIRVADLLYVF